jgi:uncharacterized membrane protein
MRVLCSHAVDITAPAEQVFAPVCDLERWPTWFGCVVSASQPEQRPLAVGVEVHVCMNAGRRRWQEEFEVTRLITNAFLSFEALYSTARRIDFRFERRGQVTRLCCSIGYAVYGGIVPTVYDALLGRGRVKHCIRESLVHLKNLVEEKSGAAKAAEDFDDLDALALTPVAKPKASPALRVV